MNMVMVTGVSGFIGQALCARLLADGFRVRAVVRRDGGRVAGRDGNRAAREQVVVGNIGPDTDWATALHGKVDCVIHTAARVHVMTETVAAPLAAFREVNVVGTRHLAEQAAAAGVRRFVYLSSVKVLGEETRPGKPFVESDQPWPLDAYAVSKWEAEQELLALAAKTGLEVVIIRPPLVYGPGVRANFLAMMRWLDKGIPLPFGAIDNQRSLVALANLVDLMVTCLAHPAAANQVFLAADGEDLSTTELLRRLGKALGKPARLLPVPARLLTAGAVLFGKRHLAQRLCGSLQVDIGKVRRMLGWQPPMSVDAALDAAARHFRETSAS